MKRLAAIVMAAIIILTGCSAKEDNIVFTAIIDEIHEEGMLVTTVDYDGFDRAYVSYAENMEGNAFNFIVGQELTFTVLTEMRESYPVQVTAVRIEFPVSGQDSDAAYRKITPEEAKEMMDAGDVIILDVRTETEFAEGHIENAVLLPDYDIEVNASEILTDKSAVILVYCRSGVRSEAAAKKLAQMGYATVYDIGGIIDWPYEKVNED